MTMKADMVEFPVKITFSEEPSEALALLKHFLYGEITPQRIQRARELLIEAGAWEIKAEEAP